MKTLLYLLHFSISTISFAQDPQLFENDWYLYEVMGTDLGTLYEVSLIEPSITPTLSISEDLTFNGVGACNTFNGLYKFIAPGEFNTMNFTQTMDDCGIGQHNNFEDEYFGFIAGGYSYTITEDSEGKILTLENAIFGYATFKSYPLSVSDFQKNRFQVYPNPAKNELFLTSLNNSGNLKLKIFNLESRLLTNLNLENQTSMDVSNLDSGIYFLNIEDENGHTEVIKFLME